MPNNETITPQSFTIGHDESRCYHCHDTIPKGEKRLFDNKNFCCDGCQTVYQILNENNLCDFYAIDLAAGMSQKKRRDVHQYDFLNDPSVSSKLLDFSDENTSKVTFLVPSMHCASCIWLLENLFKINTAVFNSKVNFLKKEVYILFDNQKTTLRDVATLMANIGYPPEVNLNDLEDRPNTPPSVSRRIYYQIGVAGFAFGNIMLLSFPEYLGISDSLDKAYAPIFGYINLILALPVLLYSARDYIVSAYIGLKNRYLNLDVPLALGIFALFGRSAYEILTQTGAGYMDSFASLIFLLLTGKWFQQKTFYHLSFERDYKSYFPISANLKRDNGTETSVALNKLEAGDVIVVKNEEIIPADGVLLRGEAQIDYAFVTGEATPVLKKSGDKIFAGGRQLGGAIEMSLTRRVNQSYLTQLWNNDAFSEKNKSHSAILADKAGRYFTGVILGVAFLSFIYWLPQNMGTAVNAMTAVLIIACPCAVALSIPFTLGNLLRIFGRKQFYLKNTNVMEAFQTADIVVFDKTGTVTQNAGANLDYVGTPLEVADAVRVMSLVRLSNHPLSIAVFQHLLAQENTQNNSEVADFEEIAGAGIQGFVNGKYLKIGSAAFLGVAENGEKATAQVGIQINGDTKGFYQIKPNYREGFAEMLSSFQKMGIEIFLLSGDNDRERPFLKQYFKNENLNFYQTPHDKLDFIKQKQSEGHRVLMIGDGLNDAGALQQADIGVVVSENTNNFSPACDAILQADKFKDLPKFIQLAASGTRIVDRAYFLAFCYNVVGLSYAVSGTLQPVIAAILMPLSSITIVLFGVISGNMAARKLKI